MSDYPQDADVPADLPADELHTLLRVLRIAAGTDGHASIMWTHAGFEHTLTVQRVS